MDLFMLQQISLFLAGASVSELSIVGKPVIFIPSPNVAEDHQTKMQKLLLKRWCDFIKRI
jgi:UDP-N-acetylglucosamine--N-acetylmuramyl-(pentapeptide) pyrophosphoryl-undecaprenol N-acetylglucosamine transferase